MSENVPTGLDGRRLPEAAQRALRERAIAAYKQGMKRGDITRALGMSRQWVWKVLRSFDKHGERAAVIGHRRGPKSETVGKMKVLTSQEERQLQAWIVDKNPMCSVNKNSPLSPAKRTTRVGIFDVTQNERGRDPWVDLPWGGAKPLPKQF